mgnify:CR=1 FL=1
MAVTRKQFAVIGMIFCMPDTDRQNHLRFDWFGFTALAMARARRDEPQRVGYLVAPPYFPIRTGR